MSLTALTREIKKCKICAHSLPLGANPVFQVHTAAKILVAGQAPGIRVHQSGIAFNDPSGDRLRQWMGIDKTAFYDPGKITIAAMGFCYPGTGKSGDLPPRPECARTWRKPLLAALPNIELVLAIGQYAQHYHLGKTKKPTLTETVRNWESYAPGVIPLPHPSPRNNIWLKKNPWFKTEVIPALRQRIEELLA